MDDATRAELLNATVDGVATEAQRAAVEELLARDPSAREELEALRAIADLLRRAPAPGVPEALVGDVMTAVQRSGVPAEASWMAWLKGTLAEAGWSWGPLKEKVTNISRGREYVGTGVGAPRRSTEDVMGARQNMFQRRMIFAGAGVLSVAALLVYFGGFYPPANEEAYGTIGAADRYRSEQITSADVKLDNPEIQAFLQSETFDRIVRDPAARAALTNEALQQAIAQDHFADAMVLTARLGANVSRLNAEAATLGRNALELQRAISLGKDAASLNQSAMDLTSKALDLQKAISLGKDAATLDQAAMELNSKALELSKQVKLGQLSGDAASLDKAAMDLASKALDLQKAASLDKAAMDLSSRALDLQKAISFGKDAASLNQSAMELSSKAVELNKQIKLGPLSGNAASLNQSAMDLSSKAVELNKQIKLGPLSGNAASLNQAAMQLNSKALELSKQTKLGPVSADANILNKSAMDLASKALELQKAADFGRDAASLNKSAMDLTSKALELQKAITFGKDAVKLDQAAASLNSQALFFQKRINLLGDAQKLDALGLDAKSLSAISYLARSNALNQAIAHGAALQGTRGEASHQ
jgi:hypothetical protein